LSTNQTDESTGARDMVQENALNASSNRPAPIAENEEYPISQKQ
jgi:hypothetical protein